jgi:hypothetical protein
MLKFSFGNSKLNKLAVYLGLAKKQVVGFDLPAGYTCKMAHSCKSFSNRKTGKITDSKTMKFRCYAASLEARAPAARRLHWHNYDLLRACKSIDEMVALIEQSLPVGVKVVRIHASGDFFNWRYFRAWCEIAYNHPDIIFFGYTKYIEHVRFVRGVELDNFKLVYSFGGKHDNMVTDEPTARVIDTPADGVKFAVPVACVNHPADDYDFVMAGQSFAIPLHGTQPAKIR